MKAIDRLPRSVKKEAKLVIEDTFEKYRRYKRMSFKDRQTSITASYEDRPSAPTNVISNPTAMTAIYNVDESNRRKAFCEQIEQAVSRLPTREQFIITERYMQRDVPYDFVIYELKMDPPISEGKYTKIRARAFILLALILGIEIKGLEQLY